MSESDGKQDVTVKRMSVEAWNIARAESKRQDVSMATWLEKAIRHWAAQRDGEIEFPSDRGVPRLPEQVAPAGVPRLPTPSFPFAEFAAAIHAAAKLCEVAGEKPTRAMLQETQRVLVVQGRMSRGLPPPAPRKPSVTRRVTRTEIGET